MNKYQVLGVVGEGEWTVDFCCLSVDSYRLIQKPGRANSCLHFCVLKFCHEEIF